MTSMTLIRHCAFTLRRTARPTIFAATRCLRTFSTTPRVAARLKKPSDQLKHFEEAVNNPAYRKLLNSPEAMKALDELQQIMQEKGIDPTAGPTATQMFQLFASASFRRAAQTLKEELEKAGIDLKDQELIKAWKTVNRTNDE